MLLVSFTFLIWERDRSCVGVVVIVEGFVGGVAPVVVE